MKQISQLNKQIIVYLFENGPSTRPDIARALHSTTKIVGAHVNTLSSQRRVFISPRKGTELVLIDLLPSVRKRLEQVAKVA